MNSQLLVGLILGAAAVAGLIARYLRASQKRPELDTAPLRNLMEFPAVVLFGSDSCVSCVPVITALRTAGVAFTEVSWENNARQIEELQILQVPTTWMIDGLGRVELVVEGTLSRRHLRILKLQSGR